MKHLIKHIVAVVGLLAGLRLLAEELTRAGLIGDTGTAIGWVGMLSRVALTPLPISNFGILVCSLSLLGMLLALGQVKRDLPTQIPLPPTPRENVHEEQQPFSPPPSTESLITKEHIEEEWKSLEEADQETIREMIIQGGLWESDMIALLQARGLLYHKARYDSLADRVSFVQCDYAGYHSILPEHHSILEGILAADYAEEVC